MGLPEKHCIGHVVPVLSTPDVAATRRYYIETLGFSSVFEFGDPPTIAGVSFGEHVQINFFEGEVKDTEGVWLYIFCQKIDQLAETFREQGVDITHGPEDKPWGLREFGFRDCNGYGIYFGEFVDSTTA